MLRAAAIGTHCGDPIGIRILFDPRRDRLRVWLGPDQRVNHKKAIAIRRQNAHLK
jgi:hypothetical protein